MFTTIDEAVEAVTENAIVFRLGKRVVAVFGSIDDPLVHLLQGREGEYVWRPMRAVTPATV